MLSAIAKRFFGSANDRYIKTLDKLVNQNPGNPEALCGQAQVAQRQGRGKDAEAIVRDLRRGANECSLADAVPAFVAHAAPPAGSKPMPQRGR